MLPLADIRVVAVEQFGAGPWASLQLAHLGAEVIKIEDPGTGGDVGRYVPPYADGEDSLFFQTYNRNKRSLSLDLAAPAGQRVLGDLVARSDAVLSNLRGDVPAQIGLTYEQLRHRNPQIVCASLSGFGCTGPRSAEPGYDPIMQAIAGWMDITGEPGGPPTKAGLSVVDFAAGFVAAFSLLAGVHQARRDGAGCDCDVSLFDTAIGMLTHLGTWHLTRGYEPEPTHHSAHASIVPFQAFQTADGWITIAAAKDKFWVRLCAVLGHPEWAGDPCFATMAARGANRSQVVALLETAIASRESALLLSGLRAAGVPCAPVNSVREALADPHTEPRDLIAEFPHEQWGTVRTPAVPVRVGEQRAPYRRAPSRDEDSGYVLTTVLGYSAEQIRSAVRAGAFGPPG